MKIATFFAPAMLALLTAATASAQEQPAPQPPVAPATSPPAAAEPVPAPASPVEPAAPVQPAAAPTEEPAPTPAVGATVVLGGDAAPTLGTSTPAKDTAQAEAKPEEKKEEKLPWRGTTIFLDQSVTTQTAHMETSPQQSYIPLYEWWISFRPRWYLTDKIYVWARFDMTKEWTNNQDTTLYREDVFGDIWSDIRYSTPVEAISKDFKTTTALRAIWPTSKESQAIGTYVTAGISQSASYKLKINGESAKALNSADFSMSVGYSHPFTRATTPTDPNFNYTRTFTEDRQFVSFTSDQLRGGPLSQHKMLASLHGGLQITPKLGMGLDMIWLNDWHYAAKGDVTIPVSGGSVPVPRSSDDTRFTQKTWFIASLDYELTDEIGLGIGYYNLASVIAPDGVRRGIVGGEQVWWSPDARVFFDVTLNLDKVYEWARGKKEPEKKAAAVTNNLRRIGGL